MRRRRIERFAKLSRMTGTGFPLGAARMYAPTGEHLGEILDPLKIESALKCLRTDGIVCLTQYNPDLGVRLEYRAGESADRVFFRRWNFKVAITEKRGGFLGRWDAFELSNIFLRRSFVRLFFGWRFGRSWDIKESDNGRNRARRCRSRRATPPRK